jgi:hypothetical protein
MNFLIVENAISTSNAAIELDDNVLTAPSSKTDLHSFSPAPHNAHFGA